MTNPDTDEARALLAQYLNFDGQMAKYEAEGNQHDALLLTVIQMQVTDAISAALTRAKEAEAERDELKAEAKIFEEARADQNRMVDRIADLIDMPNDQELDTVAFELWISDFKAKHDAAHAEIAALREALAISEALQTSQYLVGVKAGWNAALIPDVAESQAKFASLQSGHEGYLKPITEKRRRARATLAGEK